MNYADMNALMCGLQLVLTHFMDAMLDHSGTPEQMDFLVQRVKPKVERLRNELMTQDLFPIKDELAQRRFIDMLLENPMMDAWFDDMIASLERTTTPDGVCMETVSDDAVADLFGPADDLTPMERRLLKDLSN